MSGRSLGLFEQQSCLGGVHGALTTHDPLVRSLLCKLCVPSLMESVDSCRPSSRVSGVPAQEALQTWHW